MNDREMGKRQAAGVLAQCKWLRDQIARWEEAAKAVLAQELEPGERTAAVSSSGAHLGYVTRSQSARTVEVHNEEGAVAWIAERWPTEVIRTVRPSFWKAKSDQVRKLGALIDVNGVVCPYVSVGQGDSRMTTTLDEFADALITQKIGAQLLEFITPARELPVASPEPPQEQPAQTEPVEVGPPDWRDSNTFENSDAVRKHRAETV